MVIFEHENKIIISGYDFDNHVFDELKEIITICEELSHKYPLYSPYIYGMIEGDYIHFLNKHIETELQSKITNYVNKTNNLYNLIAKKAGILYYIYSLDRFFNYAKRTQMGLYFNENEWMNLSLFAKSIGYNLPKITPPNNYILFTNDFVKINMNRRDFKDIFSTGLDSSMLIIGKKYLKMLDNLTLSSNWRSAY